MVNPGYRPDGTPRFQEKSDEDKQLEVERAERIELERMKRRWDLGRMVKRATVWLARIGKRK